MLILNRKRNEMLMIGDCVGVAVLAVRGRQVKLGITAPKDVPILREELCIEIRQEAEMMKISQ